MTTLSVRVAASGHDVEQLTGTLEINTTGSNLDLGRDDVGCHFQNIALVQGQVIDNAYIEFEAVASDSGSPVNLTIVAEDTDDASVFGTGTGALDALDLTTASTTWNPSGWVINTTYQSQNITSVIQEVVDRLGWASGNNINIVIFGDGGNRRRGKAYDHTTSAAPLLVIEYTEDSGNQEAAAAFAATVGATADASAAVDAAASDGVELGITSEGGVTEEAESSYAVTLGITSEGDQLFGDSLSYAVTLGATATGVSYPARRAPSDRLLVIGREY